MDPVSETPTERSDYALLSAIYGTALIGLAASARDKPLLEQRELVPIGAATFTIAKLIVHEKVETWLRAPFVEERPDGKRPKGTRMRYAIGELLSCTRCMGAWSALAVVGLRLHAPVAGRTAITVLAAAAANDFLQTGFSYMRSAANRCELEVKEIGPEETRADGRDANGDDREGNGNGVAATRRAGSGSRPSA